jgi:perosamine synthetase
MFDDVIAFIRALYGSDGFIPLHEPKFFGNEKQYVGDCIDSTFVSSVGQYVGRFERMLADYTGARHAVATVNGTAALHIALKLAGVVQNDEVITQPLTFIATCNAIAYCGASPIFVDVDRDTLGMSPESLENFLIQYALIKPDGCYNWATGKKIAAVVPMHTFGLPCNIEAIAGICRRYSIPLVEDAAESLGSYHNGRHTGTFGLLGVLSFNGNKTITTGGGGMILTDDEVLAKRAKHLTTTAKVAHAYEFVHDEIGYNYRMPNINAALGCAQMENLDRLLASKAQIARQYAEFFASHPIEFISASADAAANFWLNAVLLKDEVERDRFLQTTNAAGVMTRPIWRLMSKLPMFKDCQCAELANAYWLEERVVNIPSSARPCKP